jgi:UDP-N-acetylglucosamine--N-acetylmuramyl-(pentapeptide) pyrophosphoryl-undecaprenol N-acetylglucosamine transferase
MSGKHLPKVLIVCGGTGGHIYPALAIADALKLQGVGPIFFAGRKGSMEDKLITPNWKFESISAVPLTRGSILQNLTLPFKLAKSLLQARKVVARVKPTFVVATGGYVSLPIILAAGLAKIPVYLQEQNAVAGIANRIGAKFATKIFVTSEDAAKAFPQGKTSIQGNPVRALPSHGSLPVPAEFEGYAHKVLVLGGSQGAQGINQKIEATLAHIAMRKDIALVWQAGVKNVDAIEKRSPLPPNVSLAGFLNPVYGYIDAADLIISRAGASTLAELLAFGKPSILFPFPFATANHQEHNARVLERAGACLVELDSDPNGLWNKVEQLFDHPEQLQLLASKAKSLGVSDAADRIAKEILLKEQKHDSI